MNEHLRTYLSAIRQKRATSVAREHTYRPPLEQLLHQLQSGLTVINDPARIACGAPDFILLQQNIPLGYIEAKDVGTDLGNVVDSDQMQRYRHSLHNLILTNYLDFQWYVGGELRAEARLGRLRGSEITADAAGAEALLDLFTRFFNQEQTVVALRETQRLMGVIDGTIPYRPLDGEPPDNDAPTDDDLPPGNDALPSNFSPTIDDASASGVIENLPLGIAETDEGEESPTAGQENAYHLDDLIEGHTLFSVRVKNALVRQGVITLRLLVAYTPEFLLQHIRNMGEKGLAEIEARLAEYGWQLAETADLTQVLINQQIAGSFYNYSGWLSLKALIKSVNPSGAYSWSEAVIVEAIKRHPYLVEVEDGLYQMFIRPLEVPLAPLPPLEPEPVETAAEDVPPILPNGKIPLTELWAYWLASLKEVQQEVLFFRYGVTGEETMTLSEVSTALTSPVTRERVRQVEQKALARFGSPGQRPFWQPLRQLLDDAVAKAGGLLLPSEWEAALDEHTVWAGESSRPFLLPLLCATLAEFNYLDSYEVATRSYINAGHLKWLDGVLKRILRKKDGLAAAELVLAVQEALPQDVPTMVADSAFVLKAIDLFERVGLGENGRYYYLRKKKEPRHPTADSGWAGKPGSRLYEWEMRLRQQFEKIAWIGQLTITEADFQELCQIVQVEAQEPNYFSKVVEGQPRLVPPAVFLTMMVLTARYAEQLPEESVDEFWNPYLRTVWGTTYTQAFMARCRKRFKSVMLYLTDAYGFDFPQYSDGDVVTPIFRHALIPRYMQADFADWLRKKWREILHIAETPALLIAHLQNDKSLDLYYSHRLKPFITGKATAETAVALISNMAAAIALHVNDGESIESISDLLADTPIEQELWREVAQVFLEVQESETHSLRQTKARLTWIWSLDNEEIALRVQNLIIPAESELEGEPDRLVWLDDAGDDPLEAAIEVEVNPWRMQSGERLIDDVVFAEPDGPLSGRLVLLTDMDEEVERLAIPPHPADNVQFFRLTQQGAYGIPVSSAQVGEGVWLVCGERPLTFLDEEGEEIEPDEVLPVPYPLNGRYQWAAQVNLTLPVTVTVGNKELLSLVESSSQPAIGRPLLSDSQQIQGLSRLVQPTFASTDITMTFEYGGERLLKQASLWLQGQDGWRWQRPLAELQQQGAVTWAGAKLQIHLGELLPKRPNFYAAELRFSLQPVLPVPLQFAVVPGLVAVPPVERQLYTPATPPQVILQGITETNVVRRDGMAVALLSGDQQQIAWTDLRHEPRLLLRFDQVDIPLAWSVPHFMAWLEPKPDKPFLTLEELQRTTLQAIGSSSVTEFTLFLSGQRGRHFPLKRGRYRSFIGHSQLYDMVRLRGGEQAVEVKAQVGSDVWTLFTVRQRPSLTQAFVEYDEAEKMVLFHTGLTEDWRGNGRFVAESLTNPFAPLIEFAQRDVLKDLHILSAPLPSGAYLFRLELDGAWLPLPETAVRFTVGEDSDELIYAQQLVQEIRQGQLISHSLAEDFVLWWAELAEADEAALTPSTLFQLATVPAKAVENFGVNHLQKLWSPLAALQTVQDGVQWLETHGYLPAWVLLPHTITLKTTERNFQLRVYPMQAMEGGRKGRGYGRWRFSNGEDSPKTAVFVEWRIFSTMQVQVEAGIPDEVPDGDWTAVTLDDVYGLHFCSRCGRLTGAKAFTLPDDILQAHFHAQATADLRDITVSPEYGGHRLLADYIPERRGEPLLDIYETYEVICPMAITHLPEPPLPAQNILNHPERRVQLLALLREVRRYATDSEPLSFWGSVARLLSQWQGEQNVEGVSVLGQTAVALGILLRTAAYQPNLFDKLRKEANLAEMDVRGLLADLNQIVPEYVQWGLTWAELLYRHSYTRFA